MAFVGSDQGDLFVQPAGAGSPVRCNGDRVTTSQWLRHGDVLRIGSTEVLCERHHEGWVLAVVQRREDPETEPPRPVTMVAERGADAGASVIVEPIDFSPSERALIDPQRPARARPAWLLTWISICGLGLAAWFLLTARAVEVGVEPSPDSLRLEGGAVRPRVGGRYLLRPGNYTVVAEKAGFQPLDVAIVVSEQPNQRFELMMEPLPGRLQLRVLPRDAEVNVFVDGQETGKTPVGEIELEAGVHNISLQGARYETWSEEIEIEGADSVLDLTVELSPRWAMVGLESEPSGAEIRIDGEPAGVTPSRIEVLAGAHEVQFSLPGYKILTHRLIVEAGQEQSLPRVRLQPIDGNLVVTSRPGDALVAVDGEYRGRTPLDLSVEPGARHRIDVSKAGFEPATELVTVGSGETQTLRVDLLAQVGEVRFAGEPRDADLIIDGEARGTADQTLQLQAVEHEIEIRKPGFESHRLRLVPKPGIAQAVRFTLRTVEEARQTSRELLVLGPQGQELRRVEVGGRFQMGASRREPGRRANEALREVELTRPFYLGAREVSNREFREFFPQHRSGKIGGISLDGDDQPAVNVSWDDAARYCNFLSRQESLPEVYEEREGRMMGVRPLPSGYRLPTEAEWAWAARWAAGKDGRKYPWGDSLPVEPGSANYADETARGILSATLPGFSDGFAATAPIGAFGPDTTGLFDLSGNVAEWVHDFYTMYGAEGGAATVDPIGPQDGEFRVIRGSSWMDATVGELRLSYRDYSDRSRPDVGFRIARFAD